MIPLYFDPGTGALVVQFIAAGVAACLLFYRTVLSKIKSVLGIKEKKNDDLPEESGEDEEKWNQKG